MGQDDPGPVIDSYLPTVMAEYATLREESAQARGAQHATIQWSLATFGAIFAGGLIFLGQSDTLNKLHVTAFVVVFGLALPWFATFASWTWWGECLRMERAGLYLRTLEEHVEGLIDHSTAPLQWERYIGWGPSAPPEATRLQRLANQLYEARSVKVKAGYVGALGIYLGATVVSVCIAWTVTSQHPAYLGRWAVPLEISYVLVVVVHLVADVLQGFVMLGMPKARLPVTGARHRTHAVVQAPSQRTASKAAETVEHEAVPPVLDEA